jgi:hypothetical protein
MNTPDQQQLVDQSLPMPEISELFPGEAELDTTGIPDVNAFRKAFRAIAHYKKLVDTANADEKRIKEEIVKEVANVEEFYSRKRAMYDARIQHWLDQLHNMMQLLQVDKFATPYGTSFYRTGRKKTWLMDGEDLLAWAKTTEHAKDLIAVKESPDRKAISEYVESTGVKGVIEFTPTKEVAVKLKEEHA